MIVPGTRAAKISGPGRRTERYHCDYGLNAAYLERLSQGGLWFSGFDDGGQVRIELPGRPVPATTPLCRASRSPTLSRRPPLRPTPRRRSGPGRPRSLPLTLFLFLSLCLSRISSPFFSSFPTTGSQSGVPARRAALPLISRLARLLLSLSFSLFFLFLKGGLSLFGGSGVPFFLGQSQASVTGLLVDAIPARAARRRQFHERDAPDHIVAFPGRYPFSPALARSQESSTTDATSIPSRSRQFFVDVDALFSSRPVRDHRRPDEELAALLEIVAEPLPGSTSSSWPRRLAEPELHGGDGSGALGNHVAMDPAGSVHSSVEEYIAVAEPSGASVLRRFHALPPDTPRRRHARAASDHPGPPWPRRRREDLVGLALERRGRSGQYRRRSSAPRR